MRTVVHLHARSTTLVQTISVPRVPIKLARILDLIALGASPQPRGSSLNIQRYPRGVLGVQRYLHAPQSRITATLAALVIAILHPTICPKLLDG